MDNTGDRRQGEAAGSESRRSGARRFTVIFVGAVLWGCTSRLQPEERPASRPTTQAVVPRDLVILSTFDGFDDEVEVEEAGPYRLYASNRPGEILATARLQAGGVLRFRRRGQSLIETDYATGNKWGTFSIPVQENVEYFWVRGVWKP